MMLIKSGANSRDVGFIAVSGLSGSAASRNIENVPIQNIAGEKIPDEKVFEFLKNVSFQQNPNGNLYESNGKNERGDGSRVDFSVDVCYVAIAAITAVATAVIFAAGFVVGCSSHRP